MRYSKLLVVGAFTLVLAVGCADVDSNDVLTSGMWANISVEADGGGTSQVSAVLKVGGGDSNTYVELSGDDQLTATLGEEEQVMTEQVLGDYHRYITTFQSDAPGQAYTVSFTRSLDEGAPESVVDLPEPFEILEVDVSHFNATEDIHIAWDPSGSDDFMELGAEGDCIWPYFQDLEGDTGSAVIPAGSIEQVGDELEVSCEVTYTVVRWKNGDLDLGYGDGGVITGRQVRDTAYLTLLYPETEE